MNDLDQILPLWRELEASGQEYVLATVVAVEGSGYRKPGARMLIAADGRRRGTISGGCLEGEAARKAFWRTEAGPVVQRYSTTSEDGDVPFGMGCGGVVHVLLERKSTAGPLMKNLALHFESRESLSIATVLHGKWIARRAYRSELLDRLDDKAESNQTVYQGSAAPVDEQALHLNLLIAASRGYENRRSFAENMVLPDQSSSEVHVEWVRARPGLFVFGAGDDAIPLAKLAHQLGWFVSIADGRSNLATATRFPEADQVIPLNVTATSGPESDLNYNFDLRVTDSAAVMTHSLEQDTNILRFLLRFDLSYLGVLGPRRRTNEILMTLVAESDQPDRDLRLVANQQMEQLHAPMGLDLGGETPAEIALSVIAEIQINLQRGSGLPLRQVRSTNGTATVSSEERNSITAA